ncbi:hypothetical protein Hanom_Chr12g01134471 [Helianthus anomalus]
MEITGRSCLGADDTKLGFDKSKAIYHRISEPPKVNQKKIDEGSSKDRKQALVVTQEDEGFKWDKYIRREKYALVAEVDNRWQRSSARYEINKLYNPFGEAKEAKRWDSERECNLDPQGYPVVNPDKVDFNAMVAVIPTCQHFYTRRLIEKDYEENLYKRLNEVFYASLRKVMELQKKKEEDVEKLVDELKKTIRDAYENQQKVDEV